MLRLRAPGIAATLGVLALAAPTARANIYTQVLGVYETDASVPPCQFSSQQLENALKGIDTYGQQYFADFITAVQTALADRASGACSPHNQAANPVAKSQGPIAPLEPGSLTAATGASLPAPMVLMAAFAAVLGLLGAIAAVWRWRGWNPRWAARWRHAWGEAGYRTNGRAADFDDWLGSG